MTGLKHLKRYDLSLFEIYPSKSNNYSSIFANGEATDVLKAVAKANQTLTHVNLHYHKFESLDELIQLMCTFKHLESFDAGRGDHPITIKINDKLMTKKEMGSLFEALQDSGIHLRKINFSILEFRWLVETTKTCGRKPICSLQILTENA